MNRTDGTHELPEPLAAAKREARQRVDDDRRRHPPDLGPIFEALAAGLFEPGFNAEEAVPDPAARRRFRIEVGVTPRTYRDRQLLKAALNLVRKTTLPVLEIAAGLGFTDPVLFTKWFKWRTGKAPTTMRPTEARPTEARPSEARLTDDDPPAPSPPDDKSTGDEDWTDQECRQAAAWEVSPERGADLIRMARELYPALDDPPH